MFLIPVIQRFQGKITRTFFFIFWYWDCATFRFSLRSAQPFFLSMLTACVIAVTKELIWVGFFLSSVLNFAKKNFSAFFSMLIHTWRHIASLKDQVHLWKYFTELFLSTKLLMNSSVLDKFSCITRTSFNTYNFWSVQKHVKHHPR